ncbi:hypothetical protein C981_01793 [Brucella abortus 78/32]|nr:hypothetical protein C055_01725 [Brucella abortus 78/36]ENR88210.1 hypothetical protein C981_01793 [Brucella abortus 78/32]ENR91755.1 hypothetical protein C043_01785 [Brucella abortus 80/101]
MHKKKILAIALLGVCCAISTVAPGMAETTLEKIQRTKKVTVGTEAAYPPSNSSRMARLSASAGISWTRSPSNGAWKSNSLTCPFRASCRA